MEEPRTHYQVSVTRGQALAVFLVLLGSLAGAYFFGVMTGLAGRDPAGAQAQPTAVVEAADDGFPPPVLGVDPRPAGRASAPAVATPPEPAPAPSGTVQLFEDRAEGDPGAGRPASPPEPAVAAAPPEAGGFWVQVVSLSSEREARSRSARLIARGYPAVVSPGPAGGRGTTVYRVRVGPFARRDEAARAASRLSVEEKTETWIVPSGR